MKILHIVNMSYPLEGGHSIRNDNILKKLKKMVNDVQLVSSIFYLEEGCLAKGRQFLRNDILYTQLMTKKLIRKYGLISSIPLLNPLLQFYLIFINSRIIIQNIRIEYFDIIHGHSNYNNGISSYLIAKKYKKKFIYDMHVLHIDNIKHHSLKYLIVRRMEEFLIRKADAIITIDAELKNHICKLFEVPPEKVFNAPNGVDTELFKRNGKLRTINIVPDNRFIIGIDNSKEIENFKFIVNNSEIISKIIPNAFFLVFGHKDHDLILDSNYFHFLPKIKSEEMPDYYSLIDLFIIPRIKNQMTETVTPLKILEIMSCEVPILVSNTKGLSSCVVNNKTGFIFDIQNKNDFFDSLQSIKINSNLKEIGSAARKWVAENKSWNYPAEQYNKAYMYVLKSR